LNNNVPFRGRLAEKFQNASKQNIDTTEQYEFRQRSGSSFQIVRTKILRLPVDFKPYAAKFRGRSVVDTFEGTRKPAGAQARRE